jgi:hypothetical protein
VLALLVSPLETEEHERVELSVSPIIITPYYPQAPRFVQRSARVVCRPEPRALPPGSHDVRDRSKTGVPDHIFERLPEVN